MKKIIITLFIATMLLAACAPATEQSVDTSADSALLVTVGDTQSFFNVEDLEALPATESTFKDVDYKGVTMLALLDSLSVDPGGVKAIKAVAADGYSVNYDPSQILKDNVLVAYALADGSPMSADDGTFRMVLPDEEGKLNPRMLVELQVIQ